MASPTHHLEAANALLEEAQKYSRSTPVRLSVLAEAQVHATLYLADLTAAIAAPQRIVVNQTFPAAEDTTDDTPAPKARTRRKAAGRMVAEAVEE